MKEQRLLGRDKVCFLSLGKRRRSVNNTEQRQMPQMNQTKALRFPQKSQYEPLMSMCVCLSVRVTNSQFIRLLLSPSRRTLLTIYISVLVLFPETLLGLLTCKKSPWNSVYSFFTVMKHRRFSGPYLSCALDGRHFFLFIGVYLILIWLTFITVKVQ